MQLAEMELNSNKDLEPIHIDDFGARGLSVDYDAAEEQKVVGKCDLHVVPILMLLYLLAFLDRINIGNARLQGLEDDLEMEGPQYNYALFIFFIPYILCEVPCNLIIKKMAPSTWICGIMAAWGCVTIGQGFVKTWGALMACRFLIGLFEAGFLPGCIYLISMYYKRFELQWRLTLFFSASILSGAISGLLAYGLSYMEGVGGYSSWRWIFILEGLATVVIALLAKLLVVDWPETASFLNERERTILLTRLKSENHMFPMDRLDQTAIRRILTDTKIYLGTIMYLGALNTGYAASFFIPSILQGMGWKSLMAQVMSVPIYIVAAIMTLCTAILSDKTKHRSGFVLIGCIVATIGYSILLAQQSVTVGVQYFALFAVTGGGFIAQPIVIGWLSNNMSGHYKQAIASAMQIGFGNCGGFFASNIFLSSEAPFYTTGYGTSLGLIWVCGIAAVIFVLLLWRENKRRDEGARDNRLALDPEEVRNLGDEHPGFRFTY
ncbi:Protein secE/sec61-gamma protein [Penicillium camemberti]|uniref:Protein secE/sec61-gamma protein n=1 Tax=Penicillium camemberti (strain FM 013) TaxID=1429867 RepID=A0A0G4PI52_PENC3|nr:Protein secE/sec61-gamma protein [Penicillium camemberti]